MGLHDWGKDTALDLVVESATWYLALCFTLPSNASDGSVLDEVSGGGYIRQEILPADWGASVSGVKRNSAIIDFPEATADWGTSPVAYFVLCTAVVDGDVLASGPLNSPRLITTGITPRFPVNSISVTSKDPE